jgi:hypothetical protein
MFSQTICRDLRIAKNAALVLTNIYKPKVVQICVAALIEKFQFLEDEVLRRNVLVNFTL